MNYINNINLTLLSSTRQVKQQSKKQNKKNPTIVMKGEIKDRYNTLIYFKSNLFKGLFK